MSSWWHRGEVALKAVLGLIIVAIDVTIVGYWANALVNDITVWTNLDGSLRGVHFVGTPLFAKWSELTLSNSECRQMEAIPATILATAGITILLHVLLVIGVACRVKHVCMTKLTLGITVLTAVTTAGIGIAVVWPIRGCHNNYVAVRFPSAVLQETPLDMAFVAVLWPCMVAVVVIVLFYLKRWLVRRGYIPIPDVPNVVALDEIKSGQEIL